MEEVGALVGDAVRGVERVRVLGLGLLYQLGADTYQHISAISAKLLINVVAEPGTGTRPGRR